jgi:uncharacterized repeat protein (TIGR04076 family)
VSKIKITVFRGLARGETFGDKIPEYLSDTDPDRRYGYHVAGQEYISVDHGYPEPVNDDVKFCSWAFAEIQKVLVYHHFENKWHKMGQPSYAACTDGTTPVIFQIERIE